MADITPSPKKSGFNWGLLLLVTGACLLALIAYNYFTQQTMYDAAGNQVGSTTTSARMPGRKGSSKSRTASPMRKAA